VPAGAPELGAHTHEVLSSLGMSTDEIEALRAKGVV
jgi:crotonobetainyl-CoA:carnitine CoA-transferase CaiB-like acyl-CoA transferase